MIMKVLRPSEEKAVGIDIANVADGAHAA